jgi:hypothetical protein
MFKEYDAFVLAKPIEGESLPVGTRGVILMVHDAKAGVYEVKFLDERGCNQGAQPTFSLSKDYMNPAL